MSRYATLTMFWILFCLVVMLTGTSSIVIIAAIPLYWVAIGMKDDD